MLLLQIIANYKNNKFVRNKTKTVSRCYFLSKKPRILLKITKKKKQKCADGKSYYPYA